jgi:hypothetical protein
MIMEYRGRQVDMAQAKRCLKNEFGELSVRSYTGSAEDSQIRGITMDYKGRVIAAMTNSLLVTDEDAMRSAGLASGYFNARIGSIYVSSTLPLKPTKPKPLAGNIWAI